MWFGPPPRPFVPVVYRPWIRSVPIAAPVVFAPPVVVPWVAPRNVVVVRRPVVFGPTFVQLR
jgi:hypothetical protein